MCDKIHFETFALESILSRLNEKIEKLEEKQLKIELPANERERDMTDTEQERYDRLQDKIDELTDEKISIECALRYSTGIYRGMKIEWIFLFTYAKIRM